MLLGGSRWKGSTMEDGVTGEADFDRYRDSYADEVAEAIRFAGVEHEAYTVAKVTDMLDRTRRHFGGVQDLRVLDVGCGIGVTDTFLVGRFANLHGVDVSTPMIDRARVVNPTVDYQTYDGVQLPFGDGEIDIAFAICVFHHVEVGDRPALLAEMADGDRFRRQSIQDLALRGRQRP